MSATLLVMRGLPASGKTTLARRWVAYAPAARARINRDDLRAMCHDGVHLGHDTEDQIIAVRAASVRALLAAGISVVVDDTNLHLAALERLTELAGEYGARVVVVDLTDVALEECLARDADRLGGATVGESVIVEMWNANLQGRPHPLPVPDGVWVLSSVDVELATDWRGALSGG